MLSALILAAALFGFLLWWEAGLKPVDSSRTDQTAFVIGKGETVAQIILRLEEEGLIRDPFRFKLYVLFKGVAKKIKVGSFPLSPSQSTPEIVGALVKGVKDVKATIIEGLRQEQIGELLAEKGFLVDGQEWQEEIAAQKLEGSLFPDTYFFPAQATQGAVLKTLKRNFEKKVTDGLAAEIGQSRLSLNQILTLASIVERESREENDRKMVAGILLKRWQKDWPLQADATVQYAVADKRCGQLKSGKCDWWPKDLTAKDLEINSSYNTYIKKGLPPGPICNPGLSAIKAVLNPIDSPYWYYLSDSEGVIHYSKTDTEQAENINRYLR